MEIYNSYEVEGYKINERDIGEKKLMRFGKCLFVGSLGVFELLFYV